MKLYTVILADGTIETFKRWEDSEEFALDSKCEYQIIETDRDEGTCEVCPKYIPIGDSEEW